tara:strand:+ start:242 stop:808 length:567 start_codon:yes stop_codon:yes gene_type:complete
MAVFHHYTAGVITPEFAFVIIVVNLLLLQNGIFGIIVGRARKKFGVEYPAMYATASAAPPAVVSVDAFFSEPDAQGDAQGALLEKKALTASEADDFNRVQRVHQNNCEILPGFLVNLVVAGYFFPVYAAIAGLIFLGGRTAYAIGYYKAVKLRVVGSFFHLGELVCLGLGIASAVLLFAGKGAITTTL